MSSGYVLCYCKFSFQMSSSNTRLGRVFSVGASSSSVEAQMFESGTGVVKESIAVVFSVYHGVDEYSSKAKNASIASIHAMNVAYLTTAAPIFLEMTGCLGFARPTVSNYALLGPTVASWQQNAFPRWQWSH